MAELRKLDSADIIRNLEHWFAQGCGLLRTIRCDSGPQFRSPFNNWLEGMGIIRETSSAYNPQSNGLAKKAVQDIKRILKKQTGKFDLEKLVSESNHTVRSNMAATPSELFMGRVVRSPTIGSECKEDNRHGQGQAAEGGGPVAHKKAPWERENEQRYILAW